MPAKGFDNTVQQAIHGIINIHPDGGACHYRHNGRNIKNCPEYGQPLHLCIQQHGYQQRDTGDERNAQKSIICRHLQRLDHKRILKKIYIIFYAYEFLRCNHVPFCKAEHILNSMGPKLKQTKPIIAGAIKKYPHFSWVFSFNDILFFLFIFNCPPVLPAGYPDAAVYLLPSGIPPPFIYFQ